MEARTGLVFDYSKKQDLLHQSILAPEGCPEWVHDRTKLWTAVESFEDHIAQTRFRGNKNPAKNEKSLRAKETYLETCKTAFTAVFALPLEITNPDHQLDLTERIVKACYVQKGLIADYAIHLDSGNPHVHIQAATRPWAEGTFSKRRYVLEREQLVEIQHLAAETANDFAREKGYNYVLDARSYADQGLKILPTRHMGPKAYHKYKEDSRIGRENEDIDRQNLLALFHHPEEIIKLVATQKVVFSRYDIEREIFKRVGGDMTLYSLLKTHLEGIEVSADMLKVANDNVGLEGEELKADVKQTVASFSGRLLEEENIVEVGKSLRNHIVFTTKEALKLEESVRESVQSLCTLKGKEISSSQKETALLVAEKENQFAFSEEQKKAIDYLLEPMALRVLTGKAGTGKTTILKPVVDAYKEAGYIPIGTAFQGKVSELLSHDLKIPAYTLDQFRKCWDKYDKLKEEIPNLQGKALMVAKRELERLGAYQLTNRHVVILDEGNMVGGNLWGGLLTRVQATGAHLRVVQDNSQIKALYGSDISRLVEQGAGHFELNDVHRQKEKWMQEASSHLNNHALIEGFKPYEERGCLTFKNSLNSAHYALSEAYVNHYVSKHKEKQIIAFAMQNKHVEELNELIRFQLKEGGFLGKNLNHKGKEFSIGDRVMFTENDHREWFVKTVESTGDFQERGVKNGTFGHIEAFDEKKSILDIRLSKDNRLIRVNLKTYDHLEYGYAMTVNKAEGQTFDRVYGFFDPLMSANKVLIWMSRHRYGFQGFISREHAVDINEMANAAGKSEYRPLVSDFSHETSPEAALVKSYMTASYKAGNLWGVMTRENTDSPSDHPEWSAFQAAQHTRNICAGEILERWDHCRTFVHQIGLKKITLEVQVGLRQRGLNEVELEALQRVESYRSLSHQVSSLGDTISKGNPVSKSSPLRKEYEGLVETRNNLAYEIATYPELHWPFFKTVKEGKGYVTYGGEVYDKLPPALRTAQKQAQTYIKAQQQIAFSQKLTSIEKGAFEELLIFKKLIKECSFLVGALKMEGALPKKEKIKTTLEETTKERDFIAYKIINSFDKYSPLLERADIEEDQLLKYAVYGEARQLALKHNLAKTPERRLELSHEIYHMVDEGKQLNKPIYGIIKGMGLEFSRLRFEKEWYSVYQEKRSLPFKNIEELSKAFVSLEDRRKSQDPSQDFKILKTHPEQQNRIVKGNISLQTQAKAIESALQQNIVGFADQIFASIGEHYHHASSSNTERRYGKKGHISLNLKTGAWIDYKDSSLSGGPLHLLTKLKGMSFKEALDYGALWTGLSSKELKKLNQNSQLPVLLEKYKEKEKQDHKEKIEKANALWNKGQPITGTIAERYLREHRKIKIPLPPDFRFLPDFKDKTSGKFFPCLMVAARSAEGEITAVQITYLDPETAEKAKIEVPKKSFGMIKGSAVIIQEADLKDKELEPTVLFVAEGVETALSLKEAGLRGTIKASLGLSNIRRLVPENPITHIVLCADHDTPGSPAAKSFEKSVSELPGRGFTVTVIKPEKLKEDFNDVLKEKGPQGVREILKDALPYELMGSITDFSHRKNNPEKNSAGKDVDFKEKFVPISKLESVKSSTRKVEPHPFEEVEKHCEKYLSDYLKKENRALGSELQNRIKLQAEKAASFIFYAHTLKGTTHTEKETRLHLLRAKYELDRISEIRVELIKEWQHEGIFNEKKDSLIAHMIAERQASIEGRLYFEAKQKGLNPPLNIEDIAKQELGKHRTQTKDLAQKLTEKFALSENAATHCAKDILRYKEIHGEKPTTDQINHMVQISREFEKSNFSSKTIDTPEIEFLRRREGDLLLRDATSTYYHMLQVSNDISYVQKQIKHSLEEINHSITHVLSIKNQKELSL